MRENNISSIKDKGLFADELTIILRQGAQAMLKQAVEEEIAEFMTSHAGLVEDCKNTSSYLIARQNRSILTLSMQRPTPSWLTLIPTACNRVIHTSPVN